MHGFVEPQGMLCALWEAQDGCCFHCDRPMIFVRGAGFPKGDMATREHVYPRSTQGRNLHNNIVLAHSGCNNERGCRAPTDLELSKAKAIYAVMGMTAFVPFSTWNGEAKFYVQESAKQAKRYTESRQRVIGMPFPEATLADVWPVDK